MRRANLHWAHAASVILIVLSIVCNEHVEARHPAASRIAHEAYQAAWRAASIDAQHRMWGDPPPASVDPHFHYAGESDDTHEKVAFIADDSSMETFPEISDADARAISNEIESGKYSRSQLISAYRNAKAGGAPADHLRKLHNIITNYLESPLGKENEAKRKAAAGKKTKKGPGSSSQLSPAADGVPVQEEYILAPPETKEEADIHVLTKLLGKINNAAAKSSYTYWQQQQQARDDPLGLTLPGGGGTDDDLDSGGGDDGGSCDGDDPHCLDNISH